LKILKGVPKTYIYRIIRKSEVRVNKKRAQASTRLKLNDIVRIPPVRVAQAKTVDSKSVVHRLDRATSGCLMLAKKRSALTTMNTMFAANNQKNNLLDKRYQALVMNGLKNPSEMVIEPLLKRSVGSGEHKMVVDEEGQYSKTRFHTIKTFANASLLEAKLFTGRTHQVRVHARHLGCPLAGDDKYGEADKRR